MFIHVFPQDGQMDAAQRTLPVIHRLTRSLDNPRWYHPLHAHREYNEFIFLSSGEAEIKADRHTFHCVEGDMILLDKNIIHSTASVLGPPRDTWCCLLSNVDLFTERPPENYILKCNAEEFTGYARTVFSQICELSRGNTAVSGAVSNYLMGSLLVIFQNKLQKASIQENAAPLSFAQQILIYINEHFTEKITLESLARVFLTSKSRISSEFKLEYETSPINYLIDKRLNESIWLMLNTAQPIHEIAGMVGYDNPYYFMKLFTSRMGISPADYREKYGENESFLWR